MTNRFFHNGECCWQETCFWLRFYFLCSWQKSGKWKNYLEKASGVHLDHSLISRQDWLLLQIWNRFVCLSLVWLFPSTIFVPDILMVHLALLTQAKLLGHQSRAINLCKYALYYLVLGSLRGNWPTLSVVLVPRSWISWGTRISTKEGVVNMKNPGAMKTLATSSLFYPRSPTVAEHLQSNSIQEQK